MPRKLSGWHARLEACPRVIREWDVWLRELNGHLENYINQGIFWSSEIEEDLQKNYKTLHRLRHWPCARLPRVEKQRKAFAERDWQKSRSEEKLKWFDALRWPYNRLTKVEKRGDLIFWVGPVLGSRKQNEAEAVPWRLYLVLVCASQPSSTFSLTLPRHVFRVITGKKETYYIFVYGYIVFFYMQHN